MVTCLIFSTLLAIKWDAFATEEGQKRKEKRKSYIVNQQEVMNVIFA